MAARHCVYTAQGNAGGSGSQVVMRDVPATDAVRPARHPWQHLRALVISDPVLAKDVFTSTSADLIERPTFGSGTLGDTFGPFGRLFAGAPGR